jgi:hypothetical protein
MFDSINLNSIYYRYIMVSATSENTARTYFTATKYGLISEKYVWMGITFPSASTSFGSLTSEYGASALSDLIGFIAVSPVLSSLQTDLLKLSKLWTNLQNVQPDRFIANGLFNSQAILAYDLTNVLLLGLDRFMKENPQISIQDLLNGNAQSFLKPSVFSNTSTAFFFNFIFKLISIKVIKDWFLIISFLTTQETLKKTSIITV